MKYILCNFITLFCTIVYAQEKWCNMEEPDLPELNHIENGTFCSRYQNYSLYPFPSHTPVKHIRVVFDVIQKEDGTGSFIGTDAQIIQKFKEFIDIANQQLTNLGHHYPLSNGNTIEDCRIQYELSGVFFFKDSEMFDYAQSHNISYAAGNYIYENYIQSHNNLTDFIKDRCLHVLLCPAKEGTNPDDPYVSGRASGYYRKEWIQVRKYELHFNKNEANTIVGHFIHETGHSLGLYHSFTGACEGFIQGSSNNYMDYLHPYTLHTSFTECQVAKMHYGLMGNSGNIQDIYVEDYCMKKPGGTMSITSDITWNSSKNLVGDMNINNASLTISCAVSIPKDGKIVIGSGGRLNIADGHLQNACGDTWGGITVQNGGVLFFSNTTVADFNIDVLQGGTVMISDDFTIIGNCHLTVEQGGSICMDGNTTLQLVDAMSLIILKPGYLSGVNLNYVSDQVGCSNPASFPITGVGSIKTFSINTFVQNIVVDDTRYFTGLGIYAGSEVTTSKPFGDVVLKNGSTVVFESVNGSTLEGGFEVEKGATFEVK